MKSLLLLFLLFFSLPGFANQLKNNPSPYLALHGNDPVNWMEWGKTALDKAKKENKLLFVSIGYFACHWCHVMQRESYSNKGIAAKLNKYFISVKVDRELNPVLDKRLIDFVQVTNGTAGWPLNVFLTPEGYPLVGATYMPREHFSGVLDKLSLKWKTEQASLKKQAREMDQSISAMLQKQEKAISGKSVNALAINYVATAMQYADTLQGGFGQGMKFPQIPQLWALLKLNNIKKNKQADDFIKLTLDKMATQGLHDELGGGFYRYTTDPDWETPHFEKMLYTNAMMPLLYFDAADHYNNTQYRETALETLHFLTDSMRGSSNAFIASLSAVDNKGEEGGFYLWTQAQLRALLSPQELKLANRFWNMQRPNEKPAGNLPRQAKPLNEVAKQLGISDANAKITLLAIKKRLKAYRDKTRKLPRDTKLLTGMNGLALAAFARGIQYDARFKSTGQKLAQFLIHLWNGKTLRRSANNAKDGTLYDYAAVSWGLLKWAKASSDKHAKQIALDITKAAWQKFYKKGYWLENPNSLLPGGIRQSHIPDSALLSAEALLLQASLASGDSSLIKQARQILNVSSRSLETDSFSYASLLALQANK